MLKDKILNTVLTPDQLAFFYLGQVGFLFKFRDSYLLIDPYLSDYVDQNCCTDSLIWKRNYLPPVSPKSLDFIQYVFCTHDHYDHMDPHTLTAIHQANPNTKFIVPKPAVDSMISYGIPASNIVGCAAGDKLSYQDFEAVPIPSAHETLTTDSEGNHLHLGYLFRFSSLTVYHSGDSCVYEGLAEAIRGSNIVMLPINGRGYYKLKEDIIGNMDIPEALELAKEAGADMIIPMHYDLYHVNGVNPAYFTDMLYHHFPNLQFHMFLPGECYIAAI